MSIIRMAAPGFSSSGSVYSFYGLFVLALILCDTAFSAQDSTAKGGDWFFDDFEAKMAKVNTGHLVFLTQAPSKPVHHHQNTVKLTASSLEDGWVELTQCHRHLDPVARVEIVFREGYVRHLVIKSRQHIEQATVTDSSVQLVNVGKNASLCIEAQSHSLVRADNGQYQLRNGPFMRKFLDGYYPMHVSMAVKLPNQLRFVSILPSDQDGFKVWQSPGQVHFDTWFEGKLLTEFIFESTL